MLADRPELRAISNESGRLGVAVILGLAEGSPTFAIASVWCSVMTIDPDHGLAGHGLVGMHRKLVPTWEEQLV